MFGNSRAKSALQDAVRILATVPGRAPNSQRLILEAAQRRAREAASLVVSAHDRTSSKLWADARLISADCAFRLGELDEGLGAMLASAATHLAIVGEAQSADLANVAFAISRAYSRLGDSKRAALFAAETYRRTPRRDRDVQRVVWSLGAMIAAGDRSHVVEGLIDLPTGQLPEPGASMFLILEHVSGYHRCSLARILEANERLAEVPAESAVLFRLTVAAELRAAGRQPEAREVLERLLKQLADEAAPSWTIARVRQVLADILLTEHQYDDALSEALASWVVLDECRYLTGSARLRRTIHDSYALARRAAMSATVGLQDWALLSELIEAARLQSASDIEGSLTEFDAVIGGQKPDERTSRSDVRTINLDGIPAPYRYIYDDLMNSRTDLMMPTDVTVGGRSRIAQARENQRIHALHVTAGRKLLALEDRLPDGGSRNALWWSTWFERGLIFWTVSHREGHTEGGQIDLNADEDLRAALAVCCEGNGLRAPWPSGRLTSPDLYHALLDCDSPDELDLTGRLARLIPPLISGTSEPGPTNAPCSGCSYHPHRICPASRGQCSQ